MLDIDTGKRYGGTDVLCTGCANEPYKVLKSVRVYLSEREQITLFRCEEVHFP
jgi:hypothetical protein